VDRYTFIVVDLHHLLLAGLPAHFESYMPSQPVRSPPLLTERRVRIAYPDERYGLALGPGGGSATKYLSQNICNT